MALIGLVEVDERMIFAHFLPGHTYRRGIGVVAMGELHIVVAQALLHAFVSTHEREVGAVQGVTVLAAPGRVEHRVGAFVVLFDRRDQLDGTDLPCR